MPAVVTPRASTGLMEDTLYWNRAHSVGHLRQEADLLGFALMVNSLTLARRRAREAVKAALGDPVSAHPLFKHAQMAFRRRRRAIPPRSRAR